MKRTFELICAAMVVGSLASCASIPPAEEGPPKPSSEGAAPGTAPDPGATTTPGALSTDEEGRPLEPGLMECPPPCEFRRDDIDDPNSELTNKIIYFEFDGSDVKQEYLDLIASHGRYLSVYGGMAVRLEGHTDERGSREYNVGLGEQRSDAVRQQLLLHGVAADQITTISYGEELPANPDHDEESWRQNRRVELVYENR